MNSLQKRFSLLLLPGVGLLCIAGALAVFGAVRSALFSELDYTLNTKVHDFASLAEWEHGRVDLEFVEKRMPEFERAEHPEFYEVLREDGSVFARSISLGGASLTLPGSIPVDHAEVYNLQLPGGRSGRAAALGIVVEGNRVNLIVARDTERTMQLLRRLMAGLAGSVLLSILLFGVILLRLISGGLRPLNDFAMQVSSIQPGGKTVRFEQPDLSVELRPIAVQLDRLLERMATALERERYLTSAMAHELNTPVAELRSVAEVAIKWPDTAEATSMAESALSIAVRMQEVVESLLTLSRCEAGLERPEMDQVDLSLLLEGLFLSSENAAKQRRLHISKEWKPGLVVTADRRMLSTVLDNALRNAVEYCPPGGAIVCRSEGVNGCCRLLLSNTQEMLDKEDLDHLFEPLWRKDAARAGTTHSGLGLAVARRFCDLLNIELSASLPTSGEFLITLVFPDAEK